MKGASVAQSNLRDCNGNTTKGLSMGVRIFKLVFAAVAFFIAARDFWMLSQPEALRMTKRWWVNGGTQVVGWIGGQFEVNARLLVVLSTLAPLVVLAIGIWLCWSVFRSRRPSDG